MVVGVVTPPHAHPEGRLEAQRLPGPPESVEATDRLRVAPPLGSPPIRPLRTHPARVRVAQALTHELVDGPEEQLGSTTFTNGLLGVTRQTTSGLSVEFIHGPQGNLIAMESAGSSYYYTLDAVGSTILLTDPSDAASASYV